MAALILLATAAFIAGAIVTLAHGGHDRVGLGLLGGAVVVLVAVIIGRPRAGGFAMADGLILGLLVGTVSIWVQRKRQRRSDRLAREEADSDD